MAVERKVHGSGKFSVQVYVEDGEHIGAWLTIATRDNEAEARGIVTHSKLRLMEAAEIEYSEEEINGV